MKIAMSLGLTLTVASREADAGVVFSDDFEGDLASTKARWGDATASGISLVTDTPAASAGNQSLQLNPGLGATTLLYKRLPQNYERLYYRYYVKYEGGDYHHTGAMIGGYEPPTNWPQGDSGLKGIRPNGDRLLNISLEEQGDTSHRLEFYNNWIDMQGSTYQGLYYGRFLIQDLNIALPTQWTCIEYMVSLNTPATAKTGELIVWIDGAEVVNFRPGAPNGYWEGAGNWRMNSGSPGFEGFRWRDTTALGLNWVKVQNFNAATKVWFDDVVVSTDRIGCIGQPAPAPARPAPPTLLP